MDGAGNISRTFSFKKPCCSQSVMIYSYHSGEMFEEMLRMKAKSTFPCDGAGGIFDWAEMWWALEKTIWKEMRRRRWRSQSCCCCCCWWVFQPFKPPAGYYKIIHCYFSLRLHVFWTPTKMSARIFSDVMGDAVTSSLALLIKRKRFWWS